jgi:hypothetical protein
MSSCEVAPWVVLPCLTTGSTADGHARRFIAVQVGHVEQDDTGYPGMIPRGV